VSKKVDEVMADIDNPEVPQSRAGRFGEPAEGRTVRRQRTLSIPQIGFAGRLGQFLRDVRAEMKRVSWPMPNEVKNTTIITLVAVIFFALYLFVVDRIWAFSLTQLNHLLNWLTGTA
jgi:preprotein translocase subunit SecE